MPRGKEKPKNEFKDWTVHAMLWIKHHWVSVVELVALGALAFAVVVGAQAYGRHRAEKATDALYRAGKIAPESDEWKAAMEEIADDYSRYFPGKAAMMKLGESYLKSGENEKAIEEFTKLADGSRNNSMLRVAALYKLAEAKLAAGDARAAAEVYQKAAADPGNMIPLSSQFMAGACLERAGDYNAAADLYRRIIADAGEKDGAVKGISEERLLWLKAKGHISG